MRWGVVCGRKASKNICQISIVEVLRLRAISRSLCDRSARRFAQDDGFVGWENIRLAENAKGSKKSQALGMTDGASQG